MAILNVYEHFEGRTLQRTLAEGTTGSRQFIVECDDPNESLIGILNDSRIPQPGDLYPNTTDCFLHEQGPPSLVDGARILFHVPVNYKSTLSQDEKDRKQNPNPLDRKASIVWKSQKVMKAHRRMLSATFGSETRFYKTFNASYGDPSSLKMLACTNSAGDPYEPILEYPATEWIATITKNVDRIPIWFEDYEDAVNDADVTLDYYGTPRVIKKGCGKLGAIALPKAKQENGIEYVQLAFEIVVRTPREPRDGETDVPSPWDEEVLDVGMRTYELLNDGTTARGWKNVEDINSMGITLPVPFNGGGQPTDTPGDGRVEEADLWWCLRRPYRWKPYSVLPLT